MVFGFVTWTVITIKAPFTILILSALNFSILKFSVQAALLFLQQSVKNQLVFLTSNLINSDIERFLFLKFSNTLEPE